MYHTRTKIIIIPHHTHDEQQHNRRGSENESAFTMAAKRRANVDKQTVYPRLFDEASRILYTEHKAMVMTGHTIH